MSAHVVFTREKTLDKFELATYSKDAPASGREVLTSSVQFDAELASGVNRREVRSPSRLVETLPAIN
jgi:hypothetical protein